MRDAAAEAGRDPADYQVVLRMVDSAGRADEVAAAIPALAARRGRRDHRQRRLGSRRRRQLAAMSSTGCVTAERAHRPDDPRHGRVARDRRRDDADARRARRARLVAHYGGFREGVDEAVAAIAPRRRLLVQAGPVRARRGAALWREAIAWRGRIDVVVVNAATMPTTAFEGADGDWDDGWQQALQVNVLEPASLIREAVAHFLEHGGGTVITLSSWAAQRGSAISSLAAYAASKAAVANLTQTVARNYARDGILAHVVAPGIVHTRLSEASAAARGGIEGSQRRPRDGRDGAARGGRRADRVPRHGHVPPPDRRDDRPQRCQQHPLTRRLTRRARHRRRAWARPRDRTRSGERRATTSSSPTSTLAAAEECAGSIIGPTVSPPARSRST